MDLIIMAIVGYVIYRKIKNSPTNQGRNVLNDYLNSLNGASGNGQVKPNVPVAKELFKPNRIRDPLQETKGIIKATNGGIYTGYDSSASVRALLIFLLVMAFFATMFFVYQKPIKSFIEDVEGTSSLQNNGGSQDEASDASLEQYYQRGLQNRDGALQPGTKVQPDSQPESKAGEILQGSR